MRGEIIAIMLATATLLAGCTGGGDAADTDPNATSAPEAEANQTAASIAGAVTDAELQPLAGVSVGIVETEQRASTDAEGAFTFNGLDAGTYTLVAERLGFESTAQRVTVALGEVSTLDVVMNALVIPDEAVFEARPVSAYITFGHAWSDYYGGWDALPLCEQCEFYVHISPNPSDIRGEASWEKSVNLPVFAEEVYYLIRKNTDNASAATPLDGETVTSGYWLYGAMPRNLEEADHEQALENLEDGTEELQIKVGGGFYSVAFQQRVEIWLSFAYNGEFPDGYSAFPPME